MTDYRNFIRTSLVLAAAASLAACSSAPGASFGGGVGGVNLGYAPPPPSNGTQGCSPQSGAASGINSGTGSPGAAGTIGTATKTKPERASTSKPARATSGSDHVGGTGINTGSGC